MRLSFDGPDDISASRLAHLAEEPVLTTDGEFGYVSHLLIAPSTSQVEWAVVVNDLGHHHAIPADLIDVDDEDDTLRVGLNRERVESLFDVTSPALTSVPRMSAQLGRIMAGLESDLGDTVQVNWAKAADSRIWDVLALGSPGIPVIPEVGTVPQPAGGIETVDGDSRTAGDEEEPTQSQRSLVADLPKSVQAKTRFSIEVKIAEVLAGMLPIGTLLNVAGGMTVTVNATVPGSFKVQSDLTQDITVPLTGDSDPHLFTFIPNEIGTYPVRFTAYNGGSFLGKLDIEVSVTKATSGTWHFELESLSLDPPRKGEASLQITYEDKSNTFRFLFIAEHGERQEVPSRPVEGDIRQLIERLVAECDAYARAGSNLSPQDAEEALRNRGFEIWRDLVPEEVKSAIIQHLDKLSQLTIFCDREIVPWELLYPQLPDGTEPGFLVQLFSVTRWVMGSQWKPVLSLSAPTFIVPDKSPASADREVNRVAGKLHSANPATLNKRRAVLDAIDNESFTCLHFACHNLFTLDDGSQISFKDGPLRPSDMALKVQRRPLSNRPTLVFLNACRTQGSAPVYTNLENWAKTFLDLGATAVIGTSWAVRSATARLFAETVYDNLVSGKNLGQAVEAARLRAKTKLGDSSWLAYTVYGDPNAVAVTA